MFELLDQKIEELSGEAISTEVAAALPADALNEEEKKRIADRINHIFEKRIYNLKIAKAELENEVDDTVERLAQTTKDLEKIPYFGKIGLFIRGMQRPIWGFALLYIDLNVLSGTWTLPETSGQGTTLGSTFWLINLLVLGFLFGERAVKNVMPMINRRMGGG